MKLIEEYTRWFFLFVFPVFIRNQGRWNMLHSEWQRMKFERTGKWYLK